MRHKPLPLLSAVAWTLLLGLALAAGLPFGVPGEWVWAPRPDLRFPLPLLGLTLLALASLVVVAATQRCPRKTHLAVASALGLTVALRTAFACLLPTAWQPVAVFWTLVIASPVATSFFTEAQQLEHEGVARYLRHYHETLPTRPFHAATHPPGLPMVFAAVRRAAQAPLLQRWAPLDDTTLAAVRQVWGKVLPVPAPRRDARLPADWELRAAWWGAVLCVLAGCGAVLLWAALLCQQVAEPLRPIAIALAATTPAALWWQPTVDSLHLLVIVAVLAGAVAWRHRAVWTRAALTGLLGGGALWLAFKNALPLAAIGLWLVWTAWREGERQRFAHLALIATLCAAPFVVAWLLFGFHPIATFQAASASHHAQAGAHARSYLPWVLLNLADFAMGLGGAWLGLVAVHLTRWWRSGDRAPSLTVCTLVVLLALDVSGLVRGEAARLWLPFIPLLTLEAVKACPPVEGTGRVGLAAALVPVTLQGLMALALHLRLEFLRPW
ncbi:hypothetical protein HRbin17_02536 [bacterium HR17]|uniref:Glycosyltransferase RgtA/B/C/D-like domain-containing protein n=1 Tax=Candidatus Fervidibacter japonicus TaxID=2035412 RepID=A0A2H5XFP2_9BACT|nr:hypothetical protein HRbin17_02536 [bacterium HR17]